MIFILKRNFKEIRKNGLKVLFKKRYTLCFIILTTPLYFIYLPLILLFTLISPIILFRFINAPSGRMGHLACEIEYYLCKKKYEKEFIKRKLFPLKVDFFYFDLVCNTQLVKMCKRQLNVIPKFFLKPLLDLTKFLSKFFKIFNKHWEGFGYHRDIYHFQEKTGTQLSFTKDELIRGKKEVFEKFGITKKSKFACVAIRDEAYLKKEFPEKDFSFHNPRNTSMEKFIPAIKEIVKKDYYVFRMGKHVKKPLSIKNKKIIDYAMSNNRSDFLDIYLASQCDFLLCSSTGIQNITEIFRKPFATLMIPLGEIDTKSKKNINLVKHHHFIKTGKKLTLEEIFSYDVALDRTSNLDRFKKKGIKLKENSATEVKDLVLDMMNNIKNKWVLSKQNQKLQNQFNKKFLKTYYKYTPVEKFIDEPGYWTYGRGLSYHGKMYSKFSYSFLKKNKNWLK